MLVNLVEHQFCDNPPLDKAGDAPFTVAGDFSTPNPAYFAFADTVIQKAAQKGIVVLLAPAYLGYGGGSEGWYQEMSANGATKLYAYGQWVGGRYQGFDNIVWINGGDYRPPDRTLTDAVARGIRAADTRHAQTVHNDRGSAGQSYWPASSWSWMDLDTAYTTSDVAPEEQTEYQRTDWLPFFNIEAYYENEGPDALGVRKQAYEAFLSGAFGEVFGNTPIWKFGTGWQAALQSQGSQDMARLAQLANARPLTALVPDFGATFLVSGRGSGVSDRASAGVSADGKVGVVYVPSSRAMTVDLSKLNGAVTARWFDPTDGSFTPVTGSPFSGGAMQGFTPPSTNAGGDSDWVLVLDGQ